MYCHCGTNNRAPQWTFTDPCKPEVRPGAREESASPAWLAAPAMNARDTTKVYILRPDTRCGSTLYRKCHSHNTPGKRHNTVMIFVRYLSEIRYFESRKPIIPTGFRYCVRLHFRHFRFRFLSGWSCFNSLVRNLNPECAWRHSFHRIKRIINTAFLSQRAHGLVRRFADRLKPGQFVKGNQRTRHVDISTIQYSHTWTRIFSYICVIEIGTVSFVKVDRYVLSISSFVGCFRLFRWYFR